LLESPLKDRHWKLTIVELYTAEGVSVLLEFMANTVNTEEVKAFVKGAPPWFYYKATKLKIHYRCNGISDGL
jgi:hypothetical protein